MNDTSTSTAPIVVTVKQLQHILTGVVGTYFLRQEVSISSNSVGHGSGTISPSRSRSSSSSMYHKNNKKNHKHKNQYCCCTIQPITATYQDPKTKRWTGRYRIEYSSSSSSSNSSRRNDKSHSNQNKSDETNTSIRIPDHVNYLNKDGSFPKKIAKELHQLFCQGILEGTITDVDIR